MKCHEPALVVKARTPSRLEAHLTTIGTPSFDTPLLQPQPSPMIYRMPISDSEDTAVAPVRRDLHPKTHPPGADVSRGYSFGVLVGPLLWISGQVPFDGTGELVGEGDIEAQSVQVHENLKAVVEEAGGTLDDVVKITTYITEPAFREPVQAVRRRYFPGPRHPASATVVADMIAPGLLVEVEAVAVLGARDAG
jgi:2-iminobutanoate/2-iminopropanoate deaminase